MKSLIKNTLVLTILFALVVGIVIGYVINVYYTELEHAIIQNVSNDHVKEVIHADFQQLKQNIASKFSILSDIFLRLIKMIIAPLVFSILVSGIGKVENVAAIGRIGIKTLIYFYVMTLIALLIGLVSVNFFQPGLKMQLEIPSHQSVSVSSKGFDAREFITHVIPDSIFNALAKNEILPIVVFSVLFGIAVSHVSKGKIIFELSEAVSEAMFKLTHYVMYFAPFGVFGSITAIVVQQGIGILNAYIYLIGVFYLTLLFFCIVVLGLVCWLFKINYVKLFKSLYEPLLLAFSTASSEAAMPSTIEALKKNGISEKIVGFVLPLGYSFNLDGSITYMTFATVFIAQAYHISLSIADQINMMLILLLSSKGIAGVPRASLVIIAGMLSYFNIPAEGLVLLLAIDQVLDMGRSATNVLGNAVASAVIAKSENNIT